MILGMTIWFVISQILVGIAIISDIMSFQFKEKKMIILFFIVSATCIGIHYFLLERYVGAIIITLGIIRFFIAYYSTWKYWKYIFISLFAFSSIIFFKDYYDILIFFAMSLSTIASFKKDDHSLRLFMMGATTTTIIYNYLIISPMGVLLEIIFLVSNMVGYYKYYLKKSSQAKLAK